MHTVGILPFTAYRGMEGEPLRYTDPNSASKHDVPFLKSFLIEHQKYIKLMLPSQISPDKLAFVSRLTEQNRYKRSEFIANWRGYLPTE